MFWKRCIQTYMFRNVRFLFSLLKNIRNIQILIEITAFFHGNSIYFPTNHEAYQCACNRRYALFENITNAMRKYWLITTPRQYHVILHRGTTNSQPVLSNRSCDFSATNSWYHISLSNSQPQLWMNWRVACWVCSKAPDVYSINCQGYHYLI